MNLVTQSKGAPRILPKLFHRIVQMIFVKPYRDHFAKFSETVLNMVKRSTQFSALSIGQT
ncbi:MAG: hypothetical protein COB65_10500 [Thalassobium sp.]|nr:MAG: hypothetical protein COB65_10500 [Thalassobium sp.]